MKYVSFHDYAVEVSDCQRGCLVQSNDWSPAPCHTPLSRSVFFGPPSIFACIFIQSKHEHPCNQHGIMKRSQGIFDDDFDEDDDDLFGNNEFFDDEYAIMNNISPSLVCPQTAFCWLDSKHSYRSRCVCCFRFQCAV
eukprot:TRINITY_DN11582_c0_g2_i14.p4 TRINITY_DN11582_c0_g2~~TRINITY_DN11582_c0_g2_i14.p4  ORF type:complete len:137 (+),score=6.80 TRINITY_DN11582_c0_g2_i14:583-993(+)